VVRNAPDCNRGRGSGLVAFAGATPKKEIADSDITSAVSGGLMFEEGVFPNDLDVSTSQGIVTLSGSVNNILAKERSLNMAESIRACVE